MVAACGISCCGFSSSWSGVELRVMCPVCRMLHLVGILFPHIKAIGSFVLRLSAETHMQRVSTYPLNEHLGNQVSPLALGDFKGLQPCGGVRGNCVYIALNNSHN